MSHNSHINILSNNDIKSGNNTDKKKFTLHVDQSVLDKTYRLKHQDKNCCFLSWHLNKRRFFSSQQLMQP